VSPELAHAHDISFVAPDLRKKLYRSEFAAQLNGFSPEDLVLALFRKTQARHWLDRALYVDAKFYMQNDVLMKVDRMSMANSLEVRSPLLDHKVMEFMASVPASLKLKGDRCKHILKEAMKNQLPSTIIDRPKQGFSIPLAEWLRSGCRDYAADWLFAQNAFINIYLRRSCVQKLWASHQRGEDYSSELWTLLMLELWGTSYRRSVRDVAVPPSGVPDAGGGSLKYNDSQ
jgi:asparagine synthase (glutamine-hydrolysing)